VVSHVTLVHTALVILVNETFDRWRSQTTVGCVVAVVVRVAVIRKCCLKYTKIVIYVYEKYKHNVNTP